MTEQSLGAAVRRVREARGMSLRSLAAGLEVSPGTLSAVERGLTPVTVTRIERIAALLDVPLAQLFNDRRGESPRPSPTRSSTGPRTAWRTFEDIPTDPIVAAATGLFVRRGFHATTMREIAAESGLSVAGVYHHYPSKEQILVDLLDLTMGEIIWRIEAARSEGRNAVESFALMVESLALFHAVRGDLAFLGASEMRAFSTRERLRLTALRDDVQHALDRQARECLGENEVVEEDLRTATRAIATMCTALPSWFRPEGPLSAVAIARSYSEYALALLRQIGPK